MSGVSAAMRLIASATVAGARHFVIVCLERGLEKAQDRRLVIDDQDADPCTHGAAPSRGKVMTKRAPRPSCTGLSRVIAAAVRLHDAFGDRKAEPGALHRRRAAIVLCL